MQQLIRGGGAKLVGQSHLLRFEFLQPRIDRVRVGAADDGVDEALDLSINLLQLSSCASLPLLVSIIAD